MSVEIRDSCLRFLRDFVKGVDVDGHGSNGNLDHVLVVKLNKLREDHDQLLRQCSTTVGLELDRLGFSTTSESVPRSIFQQLMDSVNGMLLILAAELSVLSESYETKLEEWRKAQVGVRNPDAVAPPLADDCLSVQDQSTVSSVAQFVVALGVNPYLVAGAGLDLGARMKSGRGAALAAEIRNSASVAELSAWMKYEALRNNVACASSYLRSPSVAVPMLKAMGIDVLAGFLQLCYLPLPVEAAAGAVCVSGSEARQVSPEWRRDRGRMFRLFQQFCDRTYQPELIRQLMVLMSMSAKGPRGQRESRAAPPPPFVQRGCTLELTRCLTKPKGVHAIVLALLDDQLAEASGDDLQEEEKKISVVVELMLQGARLPKADVSKYFAMIGPQLVALLDVKQAEARTRKRFASVVARFLRAAVRAEPECRSGALRTVVDPICRPLMGLCVVSSDRAASVYADGDGPTASCSVSSEELSRCLDRLEQLLLVSDRDGHLAPVFVPVYQVLFRLYEFVNGAASWVHGRVKDLLSYFLLRLDADVSARLLLAPILREAVSCGPPDSELVATCRPAPETLLFRLTDGGDVEGYRGDAGGRFPLAEETEFLSLLTADLAVSVVKDDDLTVKLVGACLSRMSAIGEDGGVSEASARPGLALAQLLPALLERDEVVDALCKKPTLAADMLTPIFAEAVDRNCGPEAAQDLAASELWKMKTATLKSCLMAYNGLLMGFHMHDDDFWEQRKATVDLFRSLNARHPDPAVRELAGLCVSSISTRGAGDARDVLGKFMAASLGLGADDGGGSGGPAGSRGPVVGRPERTGGTPGGIFVPSSASKPPPQPSSGRKLVEEVSDGAPGDVGDEVGSAGEEEGTGPTPTKGNLRTVTYDGACELVGDPEPAFRAAGLLQFSKLLEKEDPTALGKRDEILKLVKESLSDDDAYVYEMAIRGLAALAVSSPGESLDALGAEFTALRGEVPSRSLTELRLKAGEALTRVVRRLGDVAVHYRNQILNPIFACCNDPDELVRASAVSCLAELCEVVGYRLEMNVHEVLLCLHGALLDDFVEVRRAAVMLIGKLVKGLGRDVLEVLSSDLVKIWRVLKRLYVTSDDPAVRLHAQTAMEEMNDVVKKLVTDSIMNRPVEKTIYVADVPPAPKRF